MDFRMLRTFVCVAELTSFTKAADALGYAQSTVSFQIRQLEEELDTKLFERVRRTVTLTERGRAVLRYAQQIGQLEREMATPCAPRLGPPAGCGWPRRIPSAPCCWGRATAHSAGPIPTLP